MAWTTPKTWSVGSLVSAAELNEQIRDNEAHLKLLVNDDGKIPILSSTYVADVSGANLTGVAKTALANTFTAGVHNFNGGAGTRMVFPVGSDRWAT